MTKRSCGPVHCYQEREGSHHFAQTALLQRYIGVLICEIRGQGLDVPQAPTIPNINPPIWRHELDYMPVP